MQNDCHLTKYHGEAEERIYLKNKYIFFFFPFVFQESFYGLSSAILSGDVSVKQALLFEMKKSLELITRLVSGDYQIFPSTEVQKLNLILFTLFD